MNLSMSARALQFAIRAHNGQVRKYTGDPYIVHPVAVADLVRQVGGDEDMIAVAYLHDVIEDCGVDFNTLSDTFNSSIAVMTMRLSDMQTAADGNRATRKARERDKLARSGPAVQTIKLADLLDNTGTIAKHDPDFAKVYMREKRALLDMMVHGDQRLWDEADRLVKLHMVEE